MADEGRRIGTEIAIAPVIKRKARAVSLAVGQGEEIATRRVEAIELTLEGIPGDRHAGFVRPADVRVPWFKRGDPIHNERQLSIVSIEELAEIAAALGIAEVEPEWLGANLAVAGLPAFSMIPRGTRLFFPSGAALAITDQNAPCRIAGAELARHQGGERLDFRFVEVSRRLRGVVATVDKAGRIAAGDAIDVRVPEQWVWPG